MTPVMKSAPKVLFWTLFAFQSAKVSGLSFPGFSTWGWGGASENYTKVITPTDIVKRYVLPYPFQQCSTGMEGLMTKLALSPCVLEKGRCLLNRGENVTLDLEFVSNIPTDGLVGTLGAVVTRWFSPYPLGDARDLCQSEFINCPIQPYTAYRFRTSIFVEQELPIISTDIRVVVQTKTGRELSCAIVPITIAGSEREVRESLLRAQQYFAAYQQRNVTVPIPN